MDEVTSSFLYPRMIEAFTHPSGKKAGKTTIYIQHLLQFLINVTTDLYIPYHFSFHSEGSTYICTHSMYNMFDLPFCEVIFDQLRVVA